MEKKLDEYTKVPERLEAALAGLSGDMPDKSLEQGKWTIRQIVHHIVDADDMAKNIIKAAVSHNGCTYDQSWYEVDNAMAATMEYAKRDITGAVKLFRVNREHVGELVGSIPGAWDRHVVLVFKKSPEGRKLPVSYLIQSQTRHVMHHIGQILEIRKKHGLDG